VSADASSRLDFGPPARHWLEALPLGDGRLGAMCWGGAPAVLDLNEETIWSGSPASEERQRRLTAAQAQDLLAQARAAALAGDHERAEEALRRRQADYTQAYLPLGRLTIDTGGSGAGARSLDLATGVHTVRAGDRVEHTFVSAAAGVLVHAVEGERTAPAVAFTSPLQRLSEEAHEDGLTTLLRAPIDVAPGHEPERPAARWSDEPGSAVEIAVVVRWRVGPERTVVTLAAETTYRDRDGFGSLADALERARRRAADALAAPFAELLGGHAAAHGGLFGRANARFGTAPRPGSIPERLAEARRSPDGVLAHDPALAGTLFDLGRYLLISASRPGGLPATLQGIWNDSMRPPWSSNYTLNINTQMNYWPAEVTGLPETAEPLLRFIERLAETGSRTAADDFGAPGWVAHHNSDAWAYTSTVGGGHGDPSWAFWPMAGLWLVRHLREHAAFGAAEPGFERDRLWPVLAGAARFLLAWLCELPDGSLGTAPSTSPENTYRSASGRTASVGVSSTMDIALAREVLEGAVEFAPAGEEDLSAAAQAALRRLPTIGSRVRDDGLLEWDRLHDEVDPHHRHLSHLYPIYPGDAAVDGALARAAAASLDRRGLDASGWSLAWKMALWARLRRPDRVSELLALFFRDAQTLDGRWAGGLYPNLFAAHPPFQIDGNLGYVAALAECLLQSHAGVIDLLPAVPHELRSGSGRGLIARPGVAVDLHWSEGELLSATLRARPGRGGRRRVRWDGRELVVALDPASGTTLTAKDFSKGTVVEVH
jgi:alpha-L-fucosidase 2